MKLPACGHEDLEVHSCTVDGQRRWWRLWSVVVTGQHVQGQVGSPMSSRHPCKMYLLPLYWGSAMKFDLPSEDSPQAVPLGVHSLQSSSWVTVGGKPAMSPFIQVSIRRPSMSEDVER